MLRKLGLTKKEEQVYLALWKKGPSFPSELAIRTGQKRTSVYEILKKMLVDGHVAVTYVNKKKLFKANHPETFKNKIEIEKEVIKKKEDHFNRIYENLVKRHEEGSYKKNVEILKGPQLMTLLVKDIIKTVGDGEYFSIGTPGKLYDDPIQKMIMKNFLARRRQHGKTKEYAITGLHSETIRQFWEMDLDFIESHFLDFHADFSSSIYIYGPKVALFSYGDECKCVLTTDPELSEIFKFMHSQLWHILDKKNLPKPKSVLQEKDLEMYCEYQSTYPES